MSERKLPFANFACPIDGLALSLQGRQLVCANNHSYDLAKQGYVNLLPVQDKRSKFPGDSKEMVAARVRYLNTGIYQPISDKLNHLITQSFVGDGACSLLDAGCGDGYYLQRLAQVMKLEQRNHDCSILGIDISKPAIQAAAKRDKQNISWAVATNRKIPVLSDTIDAILCMFGFPVFDEFKRCLKTDGSILLVEAGPSHLIELRELLYDEVRVHELPAHSKATEQGFRLTSHDSLCYKTQPLTPEQIQDLSLMTPHFFKASSEKRENISRLVDLELTVDIHFRRYSPTC